MELRQLRYFVTVVEEESFTRAAARLHLAQPGVSAQVQQLERELGQRLLDRTGRRVTLTEAGEAILPHARAALAAADAVRGTADGFTGLLRGRVRLGTLTGAPADEFGLPGVLADFHDAHPGVEFALSEDTSARLLAALQRGELDMALVGPPDEHPPPGLSFQVLLDEPLVAVVPTDDPLTVSADGTEPAAEPGPRDGVNAGAVAGDAAPASGSGSGSAVPPGGSGSPGSPGIPLTALRGRALISLPAGTGARGALERGCAAAGFRPAVAFEASAPPVLLQLAARGLGVAVLPYGTATGAGPGLRTLVLTDPCPRARIALARRTAGPAGSAARAFLRVLATALPERLGHQATGRPPASARTVFAPSPRPSGAAADA
ncbi:LysR family transcriptional regulator [Streptomyces candidus]|uniref:DNA-binding transcriptional LysR family regulator n=1 Tax=Streptomyces candidus TaxID=67283 RepID=A0A7X0HHS2_9ACTN|nr:LysR family transcriptional regulator [Streptomyces candidus]MBB6437904.1 DNA-binding transcriptional LysR family regulator [Streptomyces candidus]GHH49795.1 LysR family transcriptional regulator [Streptomyces candidus]